MTQISDMKPQDNIKGYYLCKFKQILKIKMEKTIVLLDYRTVRVL